MIRIKQLLLLVLAALLIVACGVRKDAIDRSLANLPPADCRTVQHQFGKTQVCGKPKRIAVLGPSLLELLLALDEQPIAFGDHIQFHVGEYDNPAEQIPYLGDRISTKLINVGVHYTPSLEALVKSKPDLILASSSISNHYSILTKIAPTLLFDWFGTEANLRAIAAAVDKPEQAERILARMKQAVSNARQKFAPLATTHPKVLILSSSNLQEIYLYAQQSNYCSSLIADLGFQVLKPQHSSASLSSIPISLEELSQLNQADLAILLGFDFSTLGKATDQKNLEAHQLNPLKQAWARNAIAQAMQVSKTGRVAFLPAYLCLGLPGPIGTELYLQQLQQLLLP